MAAPTQRYATWWCLPPRQIPTTILADWNAKGQYVLDTLKSVANATQPQVRDFIAQQVSAGNAEAFKSYYIINGFSVTGNLASAEAIASLSSVSRVDAFPRVSIDSAEILAG